MSNIKIDSGIVRLTINDDPNRVVAFNPNDILFAERFYSLIDDFETKEKEYNKRLEELRADERKDEYGLPANAQEQMNLLKDIVKFFQTKIDWIFGAGTSDAIFQGVMNLDIIEQFFNGVAPYIQAAREKKTTSYVSPKSKKQR